MSPHSWKKMDYSIAMIIENHVDWFKQDELINANLLQ